MRTRTDVALYILNQKRAHLREIEERFSVTLTIAADDTLQGSVYHVLERGELASPPPAPPRLGLVQIDSHAFSEIEEEEEIGAEAEAESEAESDEDEGDEERNADAQGENGKRRRRRRRRRGREREPSGVDSDAPQPSDDALAAMVQIGGDFVAPAEAIVGDGEVDEIDAEREGDATLAEAHVEGERDGRRRRRSRRGGRRGERGERDDHAAQPGFRSPYGSWVRSADEGEQGAEASTGPVDLTVYTSELQGEQPPAAPSYTAQAAQDAPAAEAPAAGSPAAEASVESVMEAQPKPEVVPAAAAPEPAPPAPETPSSRAARARARARVELLPEAPPPPEKKGGWWQRAKSQITGG